jgi:hypothetical protein
MRTPLGPISLNPETLIYKGFREVLESEPRGFHPVPGWKPIKRCNNRGCLGKHPRPFFVGSHEEQLRISMPTFMI